MPKVSLPQLPVSGLFAVSKPSGPTSMSVINEIKELVAKSCLFVEAEKLEQSDKRGKSKIHARGRRARETVKIGQGGTLDPLADGVLVVGIGKGTKRLNGFLDCVKEYRTTALLGCETDTYDSEGSQVRVAPWRHVTKEAVEAALHKFRGEIFQAPPIFSALKMDGRPLYDYARNGIPLPRPIDKRKVTVHSLEILEWKGVDHNYRWPKKQFTTDEKKALEKAMEKVDENIIIKDELESSGDIDEPPTAFVLSMKVSAGTYVRSIVHDLGHVVGSAAHVVSLTRSRQGHFALQPTAASEDKGCVSWDVFSRATQSVGGLDEDGWTEWEREVIKCLEIVETAKAPKAS